MNRQKFLNVKFAVFCMIFSLTASSCFDYDKPMTERILQNERVAEARITESEFDMPTAKYWLEILTKNNYRISLSNVKWSLKNKRILVLQINDIEFDGGVIYEMAGEDNVWYHPCDIGILGKMLGKDLRSVDDIINNIEELYELYAFFVPRSRGEFVYNDKFIVNADFRYEEAD